MEHIDFMQKVLTEVLPALENRQSLLEFQNLRD